MACEGIFDLLKAYNSPAVLNWIFGTPIPYILGYLAPPETIYPHNYYNDFSYHADKETNKMGLVLSK